MPQLFSRANNHALPLRRARWRRITRAAAIGLVSALFGLARTGSAQAPATLSLAKAKEAAQRVSPEIRAAREAVAATQARERQAAAFRNPTLAYGREQTGQGSTRNSQNVVALEQPVEIGGQRAARSDAARLRREAAEAQLVAARLELDYDVTRAYALAVAADRRATLAEEAADAFGRAGQVSETRLAAGDVSGYANRRIGLEAARYATLRAEALLARRSARLALASLIAPSADSITTTFVLEDSLVPPAIDASGDSLVAVALRSRLDLRAAQLEVEAAAAEARLASRERVPVPTLSAGFKNEQVAGGEQRFNGFTLGLSVPLPFWDRRAGAVGAAEADARRLSAEVDASRRRVAREVLEANDAMRAIDEQLEALEGQLGPESSAALHAAQVAYTEGEIPLVEWLDAVRAYQEAESSYATLRAESLIRRAALVRAVGILSSKESQ